MLLGLCLNKMEQKPAIQPKEDFKYLVRIANTDLDGNKQIMYALTKIKGIGYSFASATCVAANVNKTKKAGYLNEEEVRRLDDAIKNASKLLPAWMLNRRKDFDDGTDKHFLTGELDFFRETDIRRMKKIKCYKGVRHILGMPVRGQRTRSNFRKNKGKGPGVLRSKIAKAAVSEAKEYKRK